MNDLLALPIVLPLLGGAVSILVGRWRTAQRAVGLTVLTALLGLSIAILIDVDRNGALATQGGGWDAPLGITLVADRLSAMMLVIASFMLLLVMVYAIGQPGAERSHVGFQSVYLILAGGVSAAFLAGDLFNLFVAIEVMLTASYVLITLGGQVEQVRSGMTYVVISLLASTLFAITLALTYAATGTMNLADLHFRIEALPNGARAALAGLLLVIFGIKAALAPLYFWLPDSYPTAPSPVTAVFAGLLTKVGFYAILRTQTLLFPGEIPGWVLMVIAAATMVIGGFGAIAQDDIKRILSFHIVSQIGFMMIGVALATVAGLAALLFYVIHHIVVKTTLFLTGGLIEHHGGSSSPHRLGNMVRTAPVLSVLFIIPAMALAGMPPLSGFVAKFSILSAVVETGDWWLLSVAVAVSLLTLYSMLRMWVGVFWAPPDDGVVMQTRPLPILMVIPTAILVTTTVAIGLAGAPLYDLALRAAGDLVEPTGYLRAVGVMP